MAIANSTSKTALYAVNSLLWLFLLSQQPDRTTAAFLFGHLPTTSSRTKVNGAYFPPSEGIRQNHKSTSSRLTTELALSSPQDELLLTQKDSVGKSSVENTAIVQKYIAGVESSHELPLYQLAIAGSIASFLGDSLMHPIDCLKTALQSDTGIGLGVWEAAQLLYATSGVSGFTHGLFTYACSDAIGGAFKFAVYESVLRRMDKKSFPRTMVVLVAASLAFVASSVIIVPGEFIKQQLQMSYYDSLPHAVEGTVAKLGIAGFFTGYEGVLYRDIPYTILELGLYDVFKRFIVDQRNTEDQSTESSSSIGQDIVAAAITGGITAFLTTPLDTVKTKLMVDDYGGASFMDCFAATVQDHGVSAVFAGVAARIAWIVPFTAIYLPTYDAIKRVFQQRYMDHHVKKV